MKGPFHAFRNQVKSRHTKTRIPFKSDINIPRQTYTNDIFILSDIHIQAPGKNTPNPNQNQDPTPTLIPTSPTPIINPTTLTLTKLPEHYPNTTRTLPERKRKRKRKRKTSFHKFHESTKSWHGTLFAVPDVRETTRQATTRHTRR